MNKLNAEQILEIIKKNYTEHSFAYNEWLDTEIELTSDEEEKLKNIKDNYYDVKERYVLNKLGLGEVKEVERYGGEGQGEKWYSVKHFVDHDVYIRIDGYYQSYDGTDFDEGYGREVKPTEKVITVYE